MFLEFLKSVSHSVHSWGLLLPTLDRDPPPDTPLELTSCGGHCRGRYASLFYCIISVVVTG